MFSNKNVRYYYDISSKRPQSADEKLPATEKRKVCGAVLPYTDTLALYWFVAAWAKTYNHVNTNQQQKQPNSNGIRRKAHAQT